MEACNDRRRISPMGIGTTGTRGRIYDRLGNTGKYFFICYDIWNCLVIFANNLLKGE